MTETEAEQSPAAVEGVPEVETGEQAAAQPARASRRRERRPQTWSVRLVEVLGEIFLPSSRLSRERRPGGPRSSGPAPATGTRRPARKPAPAEGKAASGPETPEPQVAEAPEQRLAGLMVTALGLGRLPVAPGTWASAAAAVVYIVLRCAATVEFAVLCLMVGIAFCLYAGLVLWPWAQRHYGTDDPPQFVLDEVVGMWLTCLLFPIEGFVGATIAAFILFRLCDIFKPYPLHKIEELPHGWGVMLDDVGAAAYSVGLLWAYYIIVPRLMG